MRLKIDDHAAGKYFISHDFNHSVSGSSLEKEQRTNAKGPGRQYNRVGALSHSVFIAFPKPLATTMTLICLENISLGPNYDQNQVDSSSGVFLLNFDMRFWQCTF